MNSAHGELRTSLRGTAKALGEQSLGGADQPGIEFRQNPVRSRSSATTFNGVCFATTWGNAVRSASIVLACFALSVFGGCGAGGDRGEPAAQQTVTTTATPTSESSPMPPTSQATESDMEPVDPASGLEGNRAFVKALPTVAELADALGGLWTVGAPGYDPPGVTKASRPAFDRQLALLTKPTSCRRAGAAALVGSTFKPAHEVASQSATQAGRGAVAMEVMTYRTVNQAEAELQRWKDGFSACRAFQAELTTGTYPVTVESLHIRGEHVTAMVRAAAGIGTGAIYKAVAVERVGSALLTTHAQWSVSPQGVVIEKRTTAAQAQALVAHMARRVTKGGSRGAH
jgi:hypothetical protein